jgi:DNA-binding beta-propeller fold protein YncE
LRYLALAFPLLACAARLPSRPLVIVGNDEKVSWDQDGKQHLSAPGRDTIALVDASRPEAPRVAARVPLANAVFGPPVNLALAPDRSFALVAASARCVAAGGGWTSVPDDQLHVLDLTAKPPAVAQTLHVGRGPTGVAIDARGTLALVASRDARSIAVLSLRDRRATMIGTVDMHDAVSSVAFTPDGKRALATKPGANRVALLDVAGTTVSYAGLDLEVGAVPINVAVTPDGRLALTADMGNGSGSDGKVDTVSVIDLTAAPPRVAAQLALGDAPEGLAISPDGRLAVVALLNGSNLAHSSPHYHAHGRVAALRIDGTSVSPAGDVDVGALPEGIAFSPDGSHVYVGNYLDGDVSVLRVAGGALVDSGRRVSLGGHAGSMR